MKEILSTVTIKGQVTIPVEIRRRLKVEPHDKIAFIVDDDHIRVARKGSVVERTAGAIRTNQPLMSARELREAAEQAIVDDVKERMGG